MSRKSGYSAWILEDPKRIFSVLIEAKADNFLSRETGRFEIKINKINHRPLR